MLVDHATLNRWVLKYAPEIEKQFRAAQTSGRHQLASRRDVCQGQRPLEIPLPRTRQSGADGRFPAHGAPEPRPPLRFLRKAIRHQGLPEKITIDKSGANTAAIESYNTEQETTIEIRQCKYLNNVIEQDHRAVKRLTRPMLGFKSFWAAQNTLAGIEVMHMIRKGQLQSDGGEAQTPAEQFYALAA